MRILFLRKLFCSGPPQCSSCIHQNNSKRIRLTLSSSSSFSFWIVLMNTGRTMRRIEETDYLSATQKASVKVTYKLKWMHTSAIEFMRAMKFYGTCLHSLQLGSYIDTCFLRCRKISYLLDPLQCSSCIHHQNSKRIRLTLSSSSLFSFSSSFFVVFIPRDDRGVVYMHVLEKFGGFGGFVTTGLGLFKHVQWRWVQRLWGADSTVSWWQPGMWVRIHHVTKNTQGSRRRRIEQGKNSPLLPHALVMPSCSDRPRKYSLSGGETAYSCHAGYRGSCLRRRWRWGWK